MTITKRVSGVASGGQTKRVTEEPNTAGVSFLLLEGDMQTGGADRLLLEGDAQTSGGDLLLLEGDAVESNDGTAFTKRVTI